MGIDGVDAGMREGRIQYPSMQSVDQKGLFMGHEVSMGTSVSDILEDAEEELSFGMDRTNECALKDRRERARASGQMIALLRIYRRCMEDVDNSESRDVLRTRAKSSGGANSLASVASEIFPDVTDAWAALRDLEEELLGEGGGDGDSQKDSLLDRVREGIEELERNRGGDIRAGLQAVAASASYPDLGAVEGLRDAYRSVIGEISSVAEVFSDVKARFGDSFEKGMDFLFSALSADIACDEPSMGLVHLRSVHDKLGKVRLAQDAFRMCSEVLSRLKDVHGVTGSSLDSMTLFKDVLGLCGQSFVGQMHVEAILYKAGPMDPEHQVLFLQDLQKMVRGLPDGLFESGEDRLKVFTAVQEAIDAAVEREDEWLASQE